LFFSLSVRQFSLQKPRRSTMSFHRVLLNLNDGNKLSIDDETKLKRFDEEPEAKS
jgi:hypothetical protein